MTPPPVLETDRLVMSAHVAADFEDVRAMWGDPGVTAFIGPPATRAESWARLLRYGGLWPLLGFGYWAVRERGTRRFVGDVGFGDFHREVEPAIDGVPEAGWVLAGWAHGRGYAPEAAGAALRWLDTTPHRRSVCLIRPDNAPSLRVAARLGFAGARLTQFAGHRTTLLERCRA